MHIPQQELGLSAVGFPDRRIRLGHLEGVVISPQALLVARQVGKRLQLLLKRADAILVVVHLGRPLLQHVTHLLQHLALLRERLRRLRRLSRLPEPVLAPGLGNALPLRRRRRQCAPLNVQRQSGHS